MPDYDPNNPQHPLDKWWERNKRRFMPLLFVIIPLTAAFQLRLIYLAIGQMPLWMLFGGFLLTVICLGALTDNQKD